MSTRKVVRIALVLDAKREAVLKEKELDAEFSKKTYLVDTGVCNRRKKIEDLGVVESNSAHQGYLHLSVWVTPDQRETALINIKNKAKKIIEERLNQSHSMSVSLMKLDRN